MKKLMILLAALALIASCASAPSVTERMVQLSLDGNVHGSEVNAIRKDGKKIYLGKLPINKSMSFPSELLEISVEHDYARYNVSPSSTIKIGATETSIKRYFVFTDIVPILKKDFTSYSAEVRRNLIRTINAFDIAINSPKFLFSSKVSEAKAKLDDLYVQYPHLQETKFFSYLKDMYAVFNASARVGFLVRSTEQYLSVAKEVTGQIK